MSRKKPKEKATEEEAAKNAAQAPSTVPVQVPTFEEYQCTGNVEIDVPMLCTLLDVKNIPAVITKQSSSIKHPAPTKTETEGAEPGDAQPQIEEEPLWTKPCLHVELESIDPLYPKILKVSGWKVDTPIARVLQKLLLSLNKLQSLQFWQAGLTDQRLISLMNTMSLCSNLSSVTLEGNRLPGRSYHLLLSEDSVLTHLSLRNNQMGEEGARLIGSALSTTRSANMNLVSLNLSFNSIGDAGAAYIAQGLRLNRALLCLSLSNNLIGDSGAVKLAAILGEFTLTDEEVVERRKLLLEKMQSASLGGDSDQSPADQVSSAQSKGEQKGKKKEPPKKEEKPAPAKSNKKADAKVPQGKAGKPGGKEKPSALEDKFSTVLNEGESLEIVNPLLDQSVQVRDGKIVLPGNKTLTSLNLSGNRITEKSLPMFLTAVETHGEEGGLLRLSLQRNCFPPECECYVKIKELMALVDPMEKKSSEQTEEEGQAAQH